MVHLTYSNFMQRSMYHKKILLKAKIQFFRQKNEKEKKGCCKNKNVFFPMKTIRKDDQPLIVSRVDLFLFDFLYISKSLIPPKIGLRKKKVIVWNLGILE